MSATSGVLCLALAVLFGLVQGFSDWAGLAILCVLGLALLIAAFTLTEARLQQLFMSAIIVGILGAVLALMSGVRVQ